MLARHFPGFPIGLDNDNELSMISTDIPISECAAFSSSIYGSSLPPSGWQLLHSHTGSDRDGYLGACYVRNLLTTNARAVFVHRGTVLNLADGLGNLINDIELAMGCIPLQVASAKELVQAASEKILKIYKDDANGGVLAQYLRFTSTGHSLGAVISDCVAMGGVPSITFENPGSKPNMQNMFNAMGIPAALQSQFFSQAKMLYRAYQGGVNIINTCNEQAGMVFRILNVTYKFSSTFDSMLGLLFPPVENYKFNTSYIIANTLDQHGIEKIIKAIENDFESVEIENPIGFQAGYAEYLNPSNKQYWSKYLEELWNRDPSYKIKYSKDYDKYLTWCYEQLEIVHQLAKKTPSLKETIEPNSKSGFSPLLFQSKTNIVDNDLTKGFAILDDGSQQADNSATKSRCNIL